MADNEFLEQFFSKEKKDRVSDLSKSVVHHDKFDEETAHALYEEMKEFAAASDRLVDFTPTGGSAYMDAFYALDKATPWLLDPKQVRASHQVNHMVLDEMMDLKEYEELRTYSTGDDVASGLACITLEPELETLFDRTKQAQKLADEMQQMMQQMQGLEGEAHDLDEMLEQMQNGVGAGAGLGDEEREGKAQDFQKQASLIEEAMDQLREQMAAKQDELDAELKDVKPAVRAALRKAMKEAVKDAAEADQAAQAWGLDPGTLLRLDPQKRIEMASKIRNERFKRIAQLFGPMQRMAFAEQQRRTVHSNDEIYDVESGNDLARMLPMELLALEDEMLELDFLRKYVEERLLQYKMRGEEKLAKGGIIFCEDGSGSMAGDCEIWAKAVGLTLLQIAKSQKRSFYGIHFGGPGMIRCYDFRDPKNATFDEIIAFAETFFNGGTDFVTPLSKALDVIREENSRFGAIKSDVVFATDGMCGVPEKWLKEFKEEQDRLSFRVYGVVIGGSKDSEPLSTICDKRVLTVQDMTSGNDLREIFRSL